jgi:hypothetical protein
MDMDKEVEDFKKTNAPSLIGSSVRDSSDAIPTLKSVAAIKKSIYKNSSSTIDLIPVDDAIAEGALITDEDQLDNVLDKSGHIKDDAIPDSIRLQDKELKKSILLDSSDLDKFVSEENLEDVSNTVTILGGGADEYLAPAGGTSSGYKYPPKKKNGGSNNSSEIQSPFIEPDHMRSVDDIINVVNKGHFDKASTLVLDNVAETIADGTKTLTLNELHSHESSLPEVPSRAIEVDSAYVPPAAMREGSGSRLLEEQKSRSTSNIRRPSSLRQDSFTRPNLARGDSIHSGLHDDLSISNSFDQSSQSLVSERKPRHDPNAPKVSNASSLNYLRTISRSRSRMGSDRKSFTAEDHRLESNELRQSGALINDDEMSNAPDIEYAVNKALDFVEDSHTVKGGKKISNSDDIVKNLQKGLAEVAEEDDGSNRTPVSSNDLLDQLANSAMELMIDDDDEGLEDVKEEEEEDDEEEEEEEEEGEEDKKEKELKLNVDQKAEEKEYEHEEKHIEEQSFIKNEVDTDTNKLSIVPKLAAATTAVTTDSSFSLDNMMNQLAEITELDGPGSDDELREEKEKEKEEKEEPKEEYQELESEREEEDEPDLKDVKEEEFEPKDEINENTESVTEVEGVKAINILNEKKKNDADGDADEDENLVTEKKVDLESQEEKEEEFTSISKEEVFNDSSKEIETKASVSTETKDLAKDDEAATYEVVNDVEDEKEKEQENNKDNEGRQQEETVSNLESKMPVKNKDDDIDALIAAAAREKALKDSQGQLGSDGSVYVPAVTKMTFEDEPIYLYTSFAGGFHVTTRTNRLETILTANRIKYTYRDLGTDEEAKKVWRRYSGGKTLPGIVRGKDDYIGNWEDIEEANEDYRVRSLIYETY